MIHIPSIAQLHSCRRAILVPHILALYHSIRLPSEFRNRLMNDARVHLFMRNENNIISILYDCRRLLFLITVIALLLRLLLLHFNVKWMVTVTKRLTVGQTTQAKYGENQLTCIVIHDMVLSLLVVVDLDDCLTTHCSLN